MARYLDVFIWAAAAGMSGLPAQTLAGDAAHGAQLLSDHGCVVCHKVEGQGGNAAPDLGRRISRNYTPAYLAAVLWNHVPSGAAGLGTFAFSEGQTADLFAYFASRRFFEPPGDAGRGRRLFVEKHCASCHGIAESVSANPVIEWRGLRDPSAFAQEMWNRPPAMLQAFARHGLHYPRFASPELNDLLVYLENLPGIRSREPRFVLAAADVGHALFQANGCADCHQGKLSLRNRTGRSTMADISAAMWNHSFVREENRRLLSYQEMSGLVSYLWALQGQGDRRRGSRIFEKKCAGCHENSRIPAFGGLQPGPAAMLAALGTHGPNVQRETNRKGLAWPRFGGSEMADLAAYMESNHGLASEEAGGNAAGLGSLPRIREYR